MLEGRSMDYEGMGMALGMADAFKSVRANADRNVDAANTEVRKANTEIVRLRQELAAAKAALALEVANRCGFVAQGNALRAELVKSVPGHALLKKTGRRYPDGTDQIALNLVYEARFDAKSKELGIPNGSLARAIAK